MHRSRVILRHRAAFRLTVMAEVQLIVRAQSLYISFISTSFLEEMIYLRTLRCAIHERPKRAWNMREQHLINSSTTSSAAMWVSDVAHPKYRPDIDGLRAVAVLSVMIYHAFPATLRGGFIGVDIFFVISGFLISTIIFKSLESNGFSFVDFYSRRVRRIFPALATVLLATFVLGWFILYPDEYRQLGKHIAGSAGFFSNFVLWRESGYFDAAAETKPLLHLWSLGIEEQFYIVFPMLAWLLWRARLNALSFVALVGLLSFVLNLKFVHSDAAMTFYMPQTRVWELLIGSTLALLVLDVSERMATLEESAGKLLRRLMYQADADVSPETALANIKAWLGVLLISVALLKITRDTHFPGKWALLPTLGTAFLIWAGPHAYVNRGLLSSRILVWLGKISYPLYLWHWVLLTYNRIVVGETPSAGVRCATLALAILLAWLTYRLIEKPLRIGGNSPRKTVALVIAMIAIACAGFACFKTNSPSSWFFAAHSNQTKETDELLAVFQTRLKQWQDPQKTVKCFQLPAPYDTPTGDFFERNGCLTAVPGKSSILLMGDSHSASLSLGLRTWAKSMNVNFLQTSGFYGPSLYCFGPDGRESEACETDYSREVMRTIEATKPDVLILDLYWAQSSAVQHFPDMDHYRAHVLDRVKKLANSIGAKKVIVVGQIPTWGDQLPLELIRHFVEKRQKIPERTLVGVTKESLEMDAVMRAWALPPGYRYFSVKDVLCNADGCLTRVGSNLAMDLVVWDYGHLTQAGADYVVNHGLGDLLSSTLQKP
jgi:peptidoglycan/LPS O-acetylase OafA/YrhL